MRWLSGAAAALATVVLITSCSAAGQPSGSSTTGATAGTGAHGAHGKPAAPPPAAPLRASERFVNLTLPQPYEPAAPSAGGNDEYRCFLVDPKLSDRAFLTGSQFLPQNTDLVHHAIVFRVGPDKVEAARALDARTPGEGWTCFGDAGIDDGDWIGHWAPGADETLLTQKVGYPMPPGSQLIMQVHYSLLASGGKPAGSDQSAIRLRLTDGKADLEPLVTNRLVAPIELPCAADESGPLCDREAAVRDVVGRFGEQAGGMVAGLNQFCNNARPPVASPTQHCDRKINENGTVYAVAGHMHLLGRSIKVELNPGKSGAQTLLDIPNYNFDEQAIRPLAKPVALRSGDVLRVTCTHDAGLRKKLPALRDLPARYVVWGEGTADEMCLGLLVASPAS
ncbi:monooxygenase [Streptosporangium lutulentum]|uniref:Copper type II ascorbate-dependent monooxygenase C-terminal domain-containing protein n=1 Tax=Streptosporangium lutulentum TaxID=1461250 RepID=A0ABT9Q771_9ACTN|nr:monooxygenase [Streptosporangium lutulentum]MDP9842163.1 hypothetical protein [Streptosporangium lutulentum]